MKIEKTSPKAMRLSYIGLTLIGFISFGYCWWSRFFAELHIFIPAVGFQIFIGEFFLLACLVVACANGRENFSKLGRYRYWLVLFYLFIFVKAIFGYLEWGPLALRHAALFYYSFFALLGYFLYARGFFKTWNIVLIILAMIFLFGKGHFFRPYILPVFSLMLVLISSIQHRALRLTLGACFLLAFPYDEFFIASRMAMLGSFAGGLVIASAMFLFMKVNLKLKVGLSVVFVSLVGVGIVSIPNKSNLKSLFAFQEMIKTYQQTSQLIRDKESTFEYKVLDHAQVYRKELRPFRVRFEQMLSSANALETLAYAANGGEADYYSIYIDRQEYKIPSVMREYIDTSEEKHVIEMVRYKPALIKFLQQASPELKAKKWW